MTTRRWNPFTEFEGLRHQVDRLFDDFTGGTTWPFNVRRAAFPALNVWEDAENLYAEAEIPGVNRDSLEVYAVGNELTIKGQRPTMEGEQVAYHRQERGTGEFSRVVTLPVEVDAEKISATLKDGVLLVTMPKAPAARPRKINVNSQ